MMSLLILSILHTFPVFIVDFEQSIFAGCGYWKQGKKFSFKKPTFSYYSKLAKNIINPLLKLKKKQTFRSIA